MTNFNGQTAIITGGAQGIGLSTAERLINDGCEVMIWDMDEKLGKESSEKLNCHFLKVDLTNDSSKSVSIEKDIYIFEIKKLKKII